MPGRGGGGLRTRVDKHCHKFCKLTTSHPVASYLFQSFQFFLQAIYLVGFKSQASKNEQEQHQHHQGCTRAHSHAAPAPLTSPHPLLGRREGPAGDKAWWLGSVFHIFTSIHKEHLWEWVVLVTAHGEGPAVRQTCVSICYFCTKEVSSLVLAPLTKKKKKTNSRYSPPTKPSHMRYGRVHTSIET